MKFTLYQSANDFVRDVDETLKKHEIQNNLIYRNISNALSGTESSRMVMTAVKDDNGKVLLTAIRTIPFPLVIFETDNIRNDEVVGFFAASLVQNHIEIDGITCEKNLAKSFAEAYSKLVNKSYELKDNLVLYVLEKVNDLPLPSGNFRAANNDDLYFLPYWSGDFVVACNLGGWDLDSSIGRSRGQIESNNLYLWEDSTPVSAAACVRTTTDCAYIGNVYTPPHFRGKGYSTACVSTLSRKLFDDGWKYCALYADCANPFSNKVYQSIGYKPVFYHDEYKFI